MGGGSAPSITFSPCTSHPTSRCSSQMPARRLKFESLRASHSTLKASLGRSFACGSGFRLKAPARLRTCSRLLALGQGAPVEPGGYKAPVLMSICEVRAVTRPRCLDGARKKCRAGDFADLGLDFQE